MAVIEAMACGAPVVVSDKVGISIEIIENKAGIITKCEEISLCAALSSILNNPSLKNELSLNGKIMAEKYYNIENVTDKLMRFYNQALRIREWRKE
jgi:glycosyltransferase involved in cell wall biosynthesis